MTSATEIFSGIFYSTNYMLKILSAPKAGFHFLIIFLFQILGFLIIHPRLSID